MTPSQASLTAAYRKELRRIGHHLQPVVMVSDGGVSENVVKETNRALEDHELIKVRLPAGDRAGRKALADELCAATGAVEVQSIGRMILIYRPADEPDPRKSNLLRHANL